MARFSFLWGSFAARMLWVLVLSSAVLRVHAQAQGNLVRNGGFEEDVSDWDIGWGWTYNVGIELFWSAAAEGSNNGMVYGTLFQDVPTQPGQPYRLAFAMAGNFNVPDQARMNVHWGDETLGPFTWSPGGRNMNDLGWIPVELEVIATGNPTRLTFENPFVGTQNVIRLDAVEVTLVPEPRGVVLFVLGALGLLLQRFQRRLRA